MENHLEFHELQKFIKDNPEFQSFKMLQSSTLKSTIQNIEVINGFEKIIPHLQWKEIGFDFPTSHRNSKVPIVPREEKERLAIVLSVIIRYASKMRSSSHGKYTGKAVIIPCGVFNDVLGKGSPKKYFELLRLGTQEHKSLIDWNEYSGKRKYSDYSRPRQFKLLDKYLFRTPFSSSYQLTCPELIRLQIISLQNYLKMIKNNPRTWHLTRLYQRIELSPLSKVKELLEEATEPSKKPLIKKGKALVSIRRTQGRTKLAVIKKFLALNLPELKMKVSQKKLNDLTGEELSNYVNRIFHRYFRDSKSILRDWKNLLVKGFRLPHQQSNGRVDDFFSGLPEILRTNCVTIDGKKLVELDLHACHYMFLPEIFKKYIPEREYLDFRHIVGRKFYLKIAHLLNPELPLAELKSIRRRIKNEALVYLNISNTRRMDMDIDEFFLTWFPTLRGRIFETWEPLWKKLFRLESEFIWSLVLDNKLDALTVFDCISVVGLKEPEIKKILNEKLENENFTQRML